MIIINAEGLTVESLIFSIKKILFLNNKPSREGGFLGVLRKLFNRIFD